MTCILKKWNSENVGYGTYGTNKKYQFVFNHIIDLLIIIRLLLSFIINYY